MATSPSPSAVVAPHRLSRQAQNLFVQTYRRVNNSLAAARLWETLPPQDRKALGGTLSTAYSRHGNLIGFWTFLRPVTASRAVIELGETLGFLTTAAAEWLLREGGELPRDPTEAQAQAIERGDLVLTRQPREAYWEGQQIEVDWNRQGASWDFLMIAAERAGTGGIIDRFDFGELSNANAVTKKKYRLKSLSGIPESLIRCFVNAGCGSQRLDLGSQRVHIFDQAVI